MSIARQLVGLAIEQGSSDIHLEEGSPIALRVNSDIRILDRVLSKEDMDALLDEIVGPEKVAEFNSTNDLDTSTGLDGLSRIRINVYVANEKRCITIRLLPDNLPAWESLGLPEAFINLAHRHRGMVLCTGPTAQVSPPRWRPSSITCWRIRIVISTIEDPIEFRFNHTSSSIIHQRRSSVILNHFHVLCGQHLEDPDVIYIGEMRDLETIQLAISAAETGHLVWNFAHLLCRQDGGADC